MRKCKKQDCKWEAQEDRLYYSRRCAQSDISEVSSTESDAVTVNSTIKPHGEPLEVSSDAGALSPSHGENGWQYQSIDESRIDSVVSRTSETWSENESISAPTGGDSHSPGEMVGTQNALSVPQQALLPALPNSNGTAEETRLMGFIAPSPGSDAVKGKT